VIFVFVLASSTKIFVIFVIIVVDKKTLD